MISITEIQEYPGIRILEAKPGEFGFAVQVSVIKDGIATNMELTVTCPTVGENLLLIRSSVSTEDGSDIPDGWTENRIEKTISDSLGLVKKLKDIRESNAASVALALTRLERKSKFRSRLEDALQEFSNADSGQSISLSEYLTICAEAYSATTTNVTRIAESGDTSN